MPQDEPIEFETVKKRFDEATGALQQLHDTLQSLQGADERQQQATESVAEAAESLRQMSDTVSESCDVLRSALEQTREALASAEGLATGAELAAIRSGVDKLQTQTGELISDESVLATTLTLVGDTHARVEGMLSDDADLAAIRSVVDGIHTLIDDRLSKCEQQVEETRSELAAAKERLTMIESRVAAVPDKFRRKFNLHF